MTAHEDPDREVRREAAERLLAWGFDPTSIARQLHRSQSWVYAIRRKREARENGTDETYTGVRKLLQSVGGRDSR